MLLKPYFRIYRPHIGRLPNLSYIDATTNYCPERLQLIRMYKLLQEQIITTFEYVEPTSINANTYSLRFHQLYWNICAEIETNFKGLLKAHDYTREGNWNIVDYFKINKALKLHEYEVISSRYELFEFEEEREGKKLKIRQPFADWISPSYSSLAWYQEHNYVKHDRSENFKNANLKNVLSAFTALYILLYAQFQDTVDIITEEKTAMIEIPGGDFIRLPQPDNKMGYRIIASPTWNNDEKYVFEWDSEKLKNINDSDFDKICF